ncbi:MAG TPA: Crp/Fnr family transcriptional regulator [Ktedonobacteraceae bacterium]|nr:Crp/Fnr family transcriptional regulator [Ktedonobacteraceae bacterium]
MREKQAQTQGQRFSTAQQRAESIAGKAAFLGQSPLFGSLEAAEIGELDRVTSVLTCEQGRILYRPGERSTQFFLLKSGRVQLYHLSTDGRKLIMATIEPGSCFGELPLTGSELYQSFAEAIEDALVYVMNRGDVEHLLAQKPAALLTLLQMAGQRSTQLELQLVDTTFKSTNARLATLLLQLARSEQASGDAELVVSGFSQGELADRLGVYRETVALALRELKECGAIELGRKHITLCRPELLQEQAAGQ